MKPRTEANRQSLRRPDKPFYFNTSEHLLRITRYRAGTLAELHQTLHECDDGSIFQHTFRTLQEHHFIRQGFSNDFAHWSVSACHEPVLAEMLASVDIREFTSIQGLRERMTEIVGNFLQERPQAASRPAHEPFYFCAADLVVMPTPFVPESLPDFLAALRQVSVHCIHHHFIEARLRIQKMSNDFSRWLEEEMGLAETAQAVERIDIYTNTMEGVRQKIVALVEQVA